MPFGSVIAKKDMNVLDALPQQWHAVSVQQTLSKRGWAHLVLQHSAKLVHQEAPRPPAPVVAYALSIPFGETEHVMPTNVPQARQAQQGHALIAYQESTKQWQDQIHAQTVQLTHILLLLPPHLFHRACRVLAIQRRQLQVMRPQIASATQATRDQTGGRVLLVQSTLTKRHHTSCACPVLTTPFPLLPILTETTVCVKQDTRERLDGAHNVSPARTRP